MPGGYPPVTDDHHIPETCATETDSVCDDRIHPEPPAQTQFQQASTHPIRPRPTHVSAAINPKLTQRKNFSGAQHNPPHAPPSPHHHTTNPSEPTAPVHPRRQCAPQLGRVHHASQPVATAQQLGCAHRAGRPSRPAHSNCPRTARQSNCGRAQQTRRAHHASQPMLPRETPPVWRAPCPRSLRNKPERARRSTARTTGSPAPARQRPQAWRFMSQPTRSAAWWHFVPGPRAAQPGGASCPACAQRSLVVLRAQPARSAAWCTACPAHRSAIWWCFVPNSHDAP
jgi:hypothetical protein